MACITLDLNMTGSSQLSHLFDLFMTEAIWSAHHSHFPFCQTNFCSLIHTNSCSFSHPMPVYQAPSGLCPFAHNALLPTIFPLTYPNPTCPQRPTEKVSHTLSIPRSSEFSFLVWPFTKAFMDRLFLAVHSVQVYYLSPGLFYYKHGC